MHEATSVDTSLRLIQDGDGRLESDVSVRCILWNDAAQLL